jgi:FkbH-like protein
VEQTKHASLATDLDPAKAASSAIDVDVSAVLDAPIKLVVWDLDETFWHGTLSEGEVTIDEVNAGIVRTLNRRGIVNSICSKNDHGAVQDRLTSEGLWDEFVFASINWTPKGQRIAELIEHAQLRPANVLFVDDNVQNLQEARYFVPDLQIAEPTVLPQLLSLPQLKGKDDSALTRLAQYRVLEQKFQDRASSASSNDDFLRSCQIRVELVRAEEGDLERLLELINRTNQLNYTKRRLGAEQLREMILDPTRETKYVRVADKYGDYGICGIYSLAAGHLSDFLFSCRILDMGVEKWLYEQLGRPTLQITGDVATPLTDTGAVDWIQVGSTQAHVQPQLASSGPVMLKGGCDLTPVHDFLGGDTTAEFSYNSTTGANVQGHHTEILRRCSPETLSTYGEVIDRLPFLDRDAYRSRIFRSAEPFAAIVYSVLMDYTQGLYRLNGTDFVVPQGQFTEDITDPSNWPDLERLYGSVGFDRGFLTWFADNFTFEGFLTASALQDNVRWLAGVISPASQLVLLNGAEVEIENPREPDRHVHHQSMNAALD